MGSHVAYPPLSPSTTKLGLCSSLCRVDPTKYHLFALFLIYFVNSFMKLYMMYLLRIFRVASMALEQSYRPNDSDRIWIIWVNKSHKSTKYCDMIKTKQNATFANFMGYTELVLNILWPGGTTWWHRPGSTLAQVMHCCPMICFSKFIKHSIVSEWLLVKQHHAEQLKGPHNIFKYFIPRFGIYLEGYYFDTLKTNHLHLNWPQDSLIWYMWTYHCPW